MNASRSILLVARPWARAAAIAAAVVGAAGSASAQDIISTDTTISAPVSYGQLVVGGTASPGPTLTINSGAVINISASGSPGFTVGFARTAPASSGPYAAVVQNGGSVSIGGDAQLYMGTNISSFGTLYSPASASYTLNDGSITLGSVGSSAANLLVLGRSAGNNTFTQTGGTFTVYRTGGAPTAFSLGSVGVGQNTYSISGGTFEGIGVTTAGWGMQVGGVVGGAGTLTINGSTAVFAIQQQNAVFSVGETATVNLNSGTLALNGNVTRGQPSGASAPGTVNFTLGGGTLRPYDANLTVGVATAPNTQPFNITLAPSTTSTITGVGWKTSSLHTVTMDSPLIGSGNIEFSGGTVSLTATSTYTGTTNVSGGTLSLAAGGAFASSTSISVAAGATLGLTSKTSGFSFGSGQTLGGSGSVALPTSGSGVSLAGFLAPGGGTAGTLAFTNAGTFDITSAINSPTNRLQFGLGTVSDLVTVASGTLAIGTGLLEFNDFDFTELTGFGQGTYTLFSALSPISGSLGASTSGSIGSFTGTLQQAGNEIQLVVVPEPGTLPLAGLGFAAAAYALRRRRSFP